MFCVPCCVLHRVYKSNEHPPHESTRRGLRDVDRDTQESAVLGEGEPQGQVLRGAPAEDLAYAKNRLNPYF